MAYQSDPELYHRMAAPYDSEEDAQQAISAFCEEVRAARVKHRIPEVVMFCGVYHGQNMIGGAQTMGDARQAPHLVVALSREVSRTMAEVAESEAAEWRAAADKEP